MEFKLLDIVSLLASIISIAGNAIVVQKRKEGYELCIVANIIMCLMFLFLQTNYYMAVLQVVYCGIASYGFFQWARDEKEEERIMYDIDGTLFCAVDWTRKWLAKKLDIYVTYKQWAQNYLGKSIKFVLQDYSDKLKAPIEDLVREYERDFVKQLEDHNDTDFRINFALLDKIKYSKHRCLINTGRNKEQADLIIKFLGIKPSIIKMFYGQNKLKNIHQIVKTWNIREVYEDTPRYIEEYDKLKVKCVLVKNNYNTTYHYKNEVEFQ